MNYFKYFFIALLFITACKNKEYKAENLKLTIHNTGISNYNIQYYRFQALDNKDTLNGTYIIHTLYSNNLYKFDFDINKIVNTYKLSERIGAISSYVVHNDTLFALKGLSENEVIIQPLNNTDGYKSYTLNLEKNRIGNYISYDFDGLHINIMSKGLLNTMDEFRNFYNTPMDAKITLVADTVRIEYLKVNYPEMYKKAQFPSADLATDYRKESSPKYNLFSFPLTPELTLFDTNKEITYKNFKSNYYITPAVFDTTKIGSSFSYYYQASLNYIHFSSIIYNPYKNQIYRSMYHQEKVKNKKPFSRAWSLIVGDEDADIKYEVVFNEGSKYPIHLIVPTKNGFAVPILTNDLDDINPLIFHEYEFF